MCPWIESISARPAIRTIGRVNILEVLSLILEDARILEAGTVFQPCNIAAEHARPASLQTAYEDILVVILIVIFHTCIVSSGLLQFPNMKRVTDPDRHMPQRNPSIDRLSHQTVDFAP